MNAEIPETVEIVALYYRVSQRTALWWIWLRKMVEWKRLWG